MDIVQTLGLDKPGKKENVVLNLTHADLDGAVAGIVVKNVFPNAITVKTNYAGSGEIAVEIMRAIIENLQAKQANAEPRQANA